MLLCGGKAIKEEIKILTRPRAPPRNGTSPWIGTQENDQGNAAGAKFLWIILATTGSRKVRGLQGTLEVV